MIKNVMMYKVLISLSLSGGSRVIANSRPAQAKLARSYLKNIIKPKFLEHG
jgi:hypothetical protein